MLPGITLGFIHMCRKEAVKEGSLATILPSPTACLSPGMQSHRPVQMLQEGKILCLSEDSKIKPHDAFGGHYCPRMGPMQVNGAAARLCCGLVMQHLQGKSGSEEVT